jgi:hypothetical protein
VRRLKVELINRASMKQRDATIEPRSQRERATVAFAQKSNTLKAFDRYERRALAKRNRALRELRLARAARLKEPPELVGPPRPKETGRGNPFVQDLVRLHLHSILKVLVAHPSRLRQRLFHDIHQFHAGAFNMPITVALWLKGLEGGLRLTFTPQDRQVAQEFLIKGAPRRVGGIRWQIQCPETKKWVRELYLMDGEQAFRSRHMLKLVYRSHRHNAVDRHFVRLYRLMDRIGATDPKFPPPRPKYMQRRTYEQLCQDISDEYLRALRVALGRLPYDFNLD